jgi:hypothetical protein
VLVGLSEKDRCGNGLDGRDGQTRSSCRGLGVIGPRVVRHGGWRRLRGRMRAHAWTARTAAACGRAVCRTAASPVCRGSRAFALAAGPLDGCCTTLAMGTACTRDALLALLGPLRRMAAATASGQGFCGNQRCGQPYGYSSRDTVQQTHAYTLSLHATDRAIPVAPRSSEFG